MAVLAIAAGIVIVLFWRGNPSEKDGTVQSVPDEGEPYTSIIDYNPDGTRKVETWYEDDRIVKQIFYDSYDNILSEGFYAGGTLQYQYDYLNEYDADGKLITAHIYDHDSNKYLGRKEYSYDAEGNRIAEQYYSAEEAL